MSGPYEKFEDAFEKFQTELRTEIDTALATFKQDLLREIHTVSGSDPFDAEAFRQQLLTDIHSAFEQFREELAASLVDGTPLPQYPHEHGNAAKPPRKSLRDTLKKYW